MIYTEDDIKKDLLKTNVKEFYMKYLLRADNWYFERILNIDEKDIIHAVDDFKMLVSDAFDIGFNNTVMVGSAKLGMSLSPEKFLKHFTDEGDNPSDIDIAIISTQLFDYFWRLFRMSYNITNKKYYRYISRGIYRGYGQQRINAIFEYIAGKYKLQKKHLIDEEIKKKYADRYFYELDDDTKKAIWSYEMSIVNLDKHFSKDEVRNMFYRLNLTDYSLNEQEKRKSWDSEFGKVSEQLANEIFWQDYKIFSTADVRRMRDVEYCSSILLLAREGILDQTKGDRLDQIYRELGEEYVDSKEDIEKVHNAMELIKIITEDKTNGFVNKKIQMYTLFCVMFDFSEKKISISQDMVEKLKIFIQCYTLFKNEYEIESESTEEQRTIEYLKKYKLASSEGVNKIGNRMIRFEVLKKVLLQTDGIETDIFEKTARKMEKMNSSEEETDG